MANSAKSSGDGIVADLEAKGGELTVEQCVRAKAAISELYRGTQRRVRRILGDVVGPVCSVAAAIGVYFWSRADGLPSRLDEWALGKFVYVFFKYSPSERGGRSLQYCVSEAMSKIRDTWVWGGVSAVLLGWVVFILFHLWVWRLCGSLAEERDAAVSAVDRILLEAAVSRASEEKK